MGRKAGRNKCRFWIPLSWFVCIYCLSPPWISFSYDKFSFLFLDLDLDLDLFMVSFIAHNMYLYLHRIPFFFFLNDPIG